MNLRALLLSLLLTLPAHAGLLFDAGTEQLDCGDMGSWNPTGGFTVFGWMNLASASQHTWWEKGQTGSPFDRVSAQLEHSSGELRIRWTGSTALLYKITSTPIVEGSDMFLCLTVDTGAAAEEKVHLYRGSRTVAATEDTFDSFQEGSGYDSIASENMFVGGNSVADVSLDGTLYSTVFIDGVIFDQDDCRQVQWRTANALRHGQVKAWWEVGLDGTGTQRDFGPNGYTCSVTGATVADHFSGPPLFGND